MKNIRKKGYCGTPKSKGSAWVIGHEVGGMEMGFDRRKEGLYRWKSERRPTSKRNNISRSKEPESPSQTESERQRHHLVTRTM